MNSSIAISSNEKKERLFETWQLYLLITVITVIISFAFQKFIMTRDVYYALYGKQMEDYRIDEYFNMAKRIQLWGYLVTPLFIWLRIAFVAFLIQLPLMIKYIEIPFKEIFSITAFAFLILLSADVIRFFYLYFQQTNSITAASLTYMPLALTNLLNKNNYSDMAFGFLSKINLFEFTWGYIVYRGLYKTGKIEKIDAMLITMGVWAGILILTFALGLFLRIMK